MLLLARTTPVEEVKRRTDGLSVFLVDLREALGWLAAGKKSFAELRRADWAGVLLGRLTPRQRHAIDREAPERIARLARHLSPASTNPNIATEPVTEDLRELIAAFRSYGLLDEAGAPLTELGSGVLDPAADERRFALPLGARGAAGAVLGISLMAQGGVELEVTDQFIAGFDQHRHQVAPPNRLVA